MRQFVLEASEAQFQQTVQQYATARGWEWMHIQRAINERGRWRTPVSGNLGAGWPDLVLVRDGRLVFVELKADRGSVTGFQSHVLQVLGAIPKAEVYVWRPRQWDEIMEVLR